MHSSGLSRFLHFDSRKSGAISRQNSEPWRSAIYDSHSLGSRWFVWGYLLEMGWICISSSSVLSSIVSDMPLVCHSGKVNSSKSTIWYMQKPWDSMKSMEMLLLHLWRSSRTSPMLYDSFSDEYSSAYWVIEDFLSFSDALCSVYSIGVYRKKMRYGYSYFHSSVTHRFLSTSHWISWIREERSLSFRIIFWLHSPAERSHISRS